MRTGHFLIPSKNYNPNSSQSDIFSFVRQPWLGSHPTPGKVLENDEDVVRKPKKDRIPVNRICGILIEVASPTSLKRKGRALLNNKSGKDTRVSKNKQRILL